MDNDKSYWLQRANRQREMALAATDSKVADSHSRMAALLEQRAGEMRQTGRVPQSDRKTK